MDTIIKNALNFVREYFKNDVSGHDFQHTYRVYKTAIKIAEVEKNADTELVSLIALLHDVDDKKIVGSKAADFENTGNFLTAQNISAKKINLICSEISKISFNGTGNTVPNTPEGKIAQDADRIDAMGAIGIARNFAYGASRGRAIYREEDNASSIHHFYDKLLKLEGLMNTAEGKKIARHRHQFMQNFLTEFFEEWNI